MLDWNPTLYSRFEDQRTRHAAELLARVPLVQADQVVDLGCGPGNSTELLVRRFPRAKITGTDSSDAMLAAAHQRLPQVRFELSDIAAWAPAVAPDLIYANAALQWVPDHRALVPRLFSALAPGGVLAVQMPDNRQETTHCLMRALAAQAPWASHIGDADEVRTELLGMGAYYDLLAPLASEVDVWRTIYQHPLDSAEAIVDWVRGTGLKPFVDRLPQDLQRSYIAEYQRQIEAAYPVQTDGKRLLAFPRIFFVARKGMPQ